MHRTYFRMSQKICCNPLYTKLLFWIYLLDVQGVGTYLVINFFDSKGFSLLGEEKPIIHELSEVMKRKTVDSYCFIITVFQKAMTFTFYYVLNTI